MKGPGGVQLGELGQSAQKVSSTVASNFIKPNVNAAAKQLGFKQSGSSAQQPKAPDALGDFGKVLEQNQTQQPPSGNTMQQQAVQRPDRTAEFQKQQQEDQRRLASAREELETQMKKIREGRDQNWEEVNKQEEKEKKMEELQTQQQNQQPVRAGSANPEGGKRKG